MSLISWNCQGLGNPWTVREIMELEVRYKPSFIFLMETMVSINHAERFKVKMGFEGLFFVDNTGRSGGLALFWKEKSSANLISFSKNHVDIRVLLDNMKPWRLTYFYGYPERHRRNDS